MLEQGVLDLDGRHVLAARDDDVLLAIGDHEVGLVVDRATVAGVEPPVDDGLRRLRRLVPVAVHHDVAAGQHLTLVVDGHLHPEDRSPRPPQTAGAVGGGQVVVLGPAAVHGQQRSGLGEAVDLDELPAQLGLDPLDGPGGRRRAGHHHPDRAPARDGPVPARRGIEDHGHHGRRSAQQGDAVALDPAQDLRAVHLAQDDVTPTHAGHRVRHAPAVAVELGQRVQVHVPIVHAHVPAEGGGVDPQVAVGQLHALRPRRGAARVVDAGRGVLVAVPGSGLGVEPVQQLVARRRR